MSGLIVRNCSPRAPFAGFREIEDRLNTLFAGLPAGANQSWAPAVDVRENEDHYVLEADLPGMKQEDIQLTVDDGVLTLKGSRGGEDWKQGQGYRSIERVYGAFQRSFRLGNGVDASKSEASYENGVLRVVIPKAESAKPRQIDVKWN